MTERHPVYNKHEHSSPLRLEKQPNNDLSIK